MTVLSIPKREFGLLAANVPGLRASFEQVMARRGLLPQSWPRARHRRGGVPATRRSSPRRHLGQR